MNLTLTEKLLLLALDDENGVFNPWATGFEYALAGSILLELTMVGKIELTDKKIKTLSHSVLQDDLLMPYSDMICQSDKIRKIDYWISKIANKASDIKAVLTVRLIKKRILREEEKKILWIFTSKRYPATNSRPENEVRRQLNAIVDNRATPEMEDLMLISLVDVCNLNNEVYGKEKAKASKERIKKLVEQSKTNAMINSTVKEIHDAIMAAVVLMIATSVVTTSVSTGS
nr:GPP34 family phosphoprotein [uncultured Carboxylicivirga sp.]